MSVFVDLRSRAVGVLIALVGFGPFARAQQDEAPDAEPSPYEFQRRVRLPGGSGQPRVVVVAFFTQGGLDPGGKNLVVQDARRKPLPWRVLQVGPGDVCRLAFQTDPSLREARIHYGARGGPGPVVVSPEWTATAGLLVESRRWRACDLDRVDSVRQAFDASEPIGADYVPAVFQRFNPVDPGPSPYLSRYTGTLRIEQPGRYVFFSSSQDCGFLAIDGRVVASSPGRHGPTGQARHRGEVVLAAGPHTFQYDHAASGPDSCAVAAWEPPGAGKPEVVPPAAFGAGLVARLPAGELRRQGRRLPREFAAEVEGEVPLADSEQPLVRVQFRHLASAPAARPRLRWDFGDGQTSTTPDPVHIYLHPGIYTVSLTAAGEPAGLAVVNRVSVPRPLEFDDGRRTPDLLAGYLPTLAQVEPAKLDAEGLLQLVRAFDQAGATDRAVKAARAGLFVPGRPPSADPSALRVARRAGVWIRDRLDDPSAALAFWRDAAGAFEPEPWKAECEVEAADLALNELLRPAEAKALLDAATARNRGAGPTDLARLLHRVWGDWHARQGDRASALSSYDKAAALSPPGTRSAAERDARRGAFSRSTEAFLRDKELDRARDELRLWQDEFPADKVQGYLPLLQARYQAARGRHAIAIALASDLIAVNPDSPYADRLAFLAAECHEALGRPDRARASYQGLLTDYPGSPLVSEARQKLARLEPGPGAVPPPAGEKR